MLIVLIIALVTYTGMVFITRKRMPIAVLGSSALLIYGALTGSFPADLAFKRFPSEIVILIVVLSLFTKVFEEQGLFSYVGHQFTQASKGRRILIIVLIPSIIYLTSLFMNNLSVILLFTFICLELALKFNLPVTPLLVSAIIASNIGGAPLPWADTPAVILTLYTDFTLIDFITKLFLPCGFYTILLALYCVVWFKYFDKSAAPPDKCNNSELEVIHYIIRPLPHESMTKHKQEPLPYVKILPHLEGPKPPEKIPPPPPLPPVKHPPNGGGSHVLEAHGKNPKKFEFAGLRVQMFLFIMFIVFVCIGPFINLSIAFVSMLFGAITLIFNRHTPEDLVNALPILDSLCFIVALFLVGSTLEYSGILKIAVDYILNFTGANKYLILLTIMLAAFVIATFLSAGPAAATLLPVCTQLSQIAGNRLVYAALALGILAGSSMLPWSATGGPVMLGEVNRFIKQSKISTEEREKIIKIFSLKHYLAFSIPFSLIMVILNCLILAFYVIIL